MKCGLRETSRYSRTRGRGKMFPHRNYSFSHRFAILVICSCVFITSVECFSPLWDSVKTQVFQEYEILEARGQISVVRVRLKNIKDHELIVGTNVKPNSRLILTCTAWYPSEWVYSGDADPTYSSNTTIENLAPNGQVLPLDEMNGAKRYVATVVIGPRGVKQSDTGRYNCMTASPETGMKFKTLSAYFHLFVPGKTLFTRKRGGTILYDLRKSPARIPCGVTNPRVAVSLQKLSNGNLLNVDNETMLYHPISGFYPRQDIPGTYVCTAAFNKVFELLHFTLVPKVSASAPVKQSAEEDLEWLFNSFKLGQSNRIHLSTKRPGAYSFSSEKRKTTAAPQKLSTIWKRPSEEDHEDGDDQQASIQSSPSASRPGVSTYRPVYVLFAEDLDKLQKTTERPSASSASASGSASGSASEESEEEETEVEAEESFEKTFEEKEPTHQYHFDAQNQDNPPILLQQLLASTKRPSPTPPVSMRPSLHHQYGTTYLPFLNFLNSESAVVQYKPLRNPGPSYSYSSFLTRRTTTPRPQTKPFQGHIVYDLQTNKLVLHNSNGGTITRPTTERPTTRRPTTRFKIPSLPTERWPSSSKKTRPTPKTTTTTTTPPPPLIPDSVVCINSPCGANAKCFANTVYYHKQKETRREPACKCIDNYHGNPYLECRPPSPEETDYISFNNTGLFNKRSGQPTKTIALEELEEGHLQNSDVFHSNEPVIVDMRKK